MANIDLTKHVKIWFSKKNIDNTNEYMPLVNRLRLIKHRTTYPNDTITLVVDKSSLSESEKKKLIQFCKDYSLHLLDLADIKEKIEALNIDDEKKQILLDLLKLAEQETTDPLGNPAAASDIIRLICQALELGIYSDMDAPLDHGWEFYLLNNLPNENEIKQSKLDNCYFFSRTSPDFYCKKSGAIEKFQLNETLHKKFINDTQEHDETTPLQKIKSKFDIKSLWISLLRTAKDHTPPKRRTKETIDLPFLIETRLVDEKLWLNNGILWFKNDDPILYDMLNIIIENYTSEDPFAKRKEWSNLEELKTKKVFNPLIKHVVSLTGPGVLGSALGKKYKPTYNKTTQQIFILKKDTNENLICPDINFLSPSPLESNEGDFSWVEDGMKNLEFDAFMLKISTVKIMDYCSSHRKSKKTSIRFFEENKETEKYSFKEHENKETTKNIISEIPGKEILSFLKKLIAYGSIKKIIIDFETLSIITKKIPVTDCTPLFSLLASTGVLATLLEQEGIAGLRQFNKENPLIRFLIIRHISLNTYHKIIHSAQDFKEIMSFTPRKHHCAFLIKFHQTGILEKISKENVFNILKFSFSYLHQEHDKQLFLDLIISKNGLLQKVADDILDIDIQLPEIISPHPEDLYLSFLNYLESSGIANKLLKKITDLNDTKALLQLNKRFTEKFLILENLPEKFLKKLFEENRDNIYSIIDGNQKMSFYKFFVQFSIPNVENELQIYRANQIISELTTDERKILVINISTIDKIANLLCYTHTYSSDIRYDSCIRFFKQLIEDSILIELLRNTSQTIGEENPVVQCLKKYCPDTDDWQNFLDFAKEQNPDIIDFLAPEQKIVPQTESPQENSPQEDTSYCCLLM